LLLLAVPATTQEPTPSELAAVDAYRLGSFTQAIELYTRALSETDDPTHRARLHVRIAWVLFNDERSDELEQHFRAALEEDAGVSLPRDYYTADFLTRFEDQRRRHLALHRPTPALPTPQPQPPAPTPRPGPPAYVPRTGLVGWWSFDSVAGDTVSDSSERGHHAVVHGASQVPGRSGRALRFDGAEEVTLPSAPPLDTLQDGDYTIAVWFMPGAVPEDQAGGEGQQYAIVAKAGYHEGLTYTWEQRFSMQHWLSGNLFKGTFSTTTFEPGSFHHLVGVVDRTHGATMLYVDGRLEQTTSWQPAARARDFGPARWRLGIADPDSNQWQWAARGVVDELGMWQRVLSPDEIAALATVHSGVPAPVD
jgi:hypothetical protein